MSDLGFGLLAGIAVRTALVFLFLIVGLRLTGRRQVAELNLHDLLLVLIVANSVQNAMTKGDGRLSVALVSAGTLIAIGLLLATLLSKYPSSEKWIVGEPTVLLEDGRTIRSQMRSAGVTDNELMAAVRQQKLTKLSEVKLAILEVDGSISAITRDQDSNV